MRNSVVSLEDIKSVGHALGQQLASHRKAFGLNQHQLAPLLRYSRSTIANVETGRQQAPKGFWQRADQVMNAKGALIRGYDELQALIQQRRQELADALEAERAAKFRQVAQTLGVMVKPATSEHADQKKRPAAGSYPVLPIQIDPDVPAEPWARLVRALTHPDRLDEPAVEHLEHRTGEFFRREDLGHIDGLATDVQAHIRRIQRLLDGAPDLYRRRLLVALGEAHALAGWIAWNSMDTIRADEAYQQAEQTARETGDRALLACSFIYRSHLVETLGQLPTAHRLLVDAQCHLTDRHHPATRSWAAAREAEVSAALGDRTTARYALERAIVAYDYVRPHHERSWTGSLTPGLLAATTITTYARLNSPHLEVVAPATLAALSEIDPKRKTMALADVATAALRRERYDRAAQLGHEALDLAATHTNRLITERLDTLHRVIKDKTDVPVLGKLHDRLVSRLT